MTTRRLAAILGFLGVALGAFGAHGLENWSPVDPFARAEGWWETGALYHLLHAVAVLGAGGHDPAARPGASAWLFTAGIVIFSGSLYAMALGAPTGLGMVTPVGGLAFLAGWLMLLRR